MRPRNLALLLVVLLVFGWQAWQRRAQDGVGLPGAVATPTAEARAQREARGERDARSAPSRETPATTPDASALPHEVSQVLASIHAGGPYRYDRDGVVFGNFEGRLPRQARGYYHEYTVPTPGARNRGARRIIAGGSPPREFWYTADHYDSFVRLGDDAAGAP